MKQLMDGIDAFGQITEEMMDIADRKAQLDADIYEGLSKCVTLVEELKHHYEVVVNNLISSKELSFTGAEKAIRGDKEEQ